jgi:hypothetical protein
VYRDGDLEGEQKTFSNSFFSNYVVAPRGLGCDVFFFMFSATSTKETTTMRVCIYRHCHILNLRCCLHQGDDDDERTFIVVIIFFHLDYYLQHDNDYKHDLWSSLFI